MRKKFFQRRKSHPLSDAYLYADSYPSSKILESSIGDSAKEYHTLVAVPKPYDLPFYADGCYSYPVVSDSERNVLSNFISTLYDDSDTDRINVLLLIGAAKTGKTHLLNLIYTSLRETFPHKEISLEDADNVIDGIRCRLDYHVGNPLEYVFKNDILLLDRCSFNMGDRIAYRSYSLIAKHYLDTGGICVMAFNEETLNTKQEFVDFLRELNYNGTNPHFRYYFLSEPNESCRAQYAREYLRENHTHISRSTMNWIAKKADSMSELNDVLTEITLYNSSSKRR